MESLGEKLKTARENKGLNYDQVSRETNISIRFLECMEMENFSGFPGETYIIGFIKNYGTYLELDVQKLLSLYRALKIQEQPLPVEQLLKPQTNISNILFISAIVIIILGLIAGGIYFIFFGRPEKIPLSVPDKHSPVEYSMEGTSMEKRLYVNDSILIPVKSDTYRLELFNLGDAVTIHTPETSIILDLSQEVNVDLTNNGLHDLHITVIDFAKNNADMGALLHFTLLETIAIPEDPEDADQLTPEIRQVAANSTLIPSTPNAYPFTLRCSFQGFCMFRWEVLNERDRQERNERYFQRSEELNIQAQNGIRLWASNAHAAKLQLIGGGRTIPVELGSAGEVVVAEIRWMRSENNNFRLVYSRLETGTN
jgi:cytoskeletal protein RodZ